MLVYPALILTYTGQATYLIKNPEDISRASYKSLPNHVYGPMFVVATLAAIVVSQALITASFSIIKQLMALGYFPRVKMVHSSKKNEGRIYSPEINYLLMVLCLDILLGFRGGAAVGDAYEKAIVEQACGIRSEVGSSTQDESGLFAQIDHKDKIETRIKVLVQTFQAQLTQELEVLYKTVEVSATQQQHLTTMEKHMQSFVSTKQMLQKNLGT